mmetsp:Transcript_25158/g.40898  ORF Transcript_25158/g.40898 Transcript_25158/m.40898 type:complete len:149 (-) Transcript_25158:191-637(-)|eukprot:CAMPEP_0196142748 /NCGR_PEP_ID=MMETSP0910-20130528/12232_1 /TAXON_ID=49265 /ORGANISM="Thalassiosira rotula, Strain GSO102" /LENGTH=148 /DNA_ID=CAMNT_0041404107 /DNA_START=171 /DNA_END=617 /DNA_ORIENTATION=+
MTRSLLTVAVAAAAVTAVNAFAPSLPVRAATASISPRPLMAVLDVGSEAAFDETVSGAGDKLVIIDYSTTWCGPCKVIAPKFDEFSETYPDSIFVKVIGDATPDASQLMKREGVRSVPSFHYFKNGEKVDVVNGANSEAIEAAIKKHA